MLLCVVSIMQGEHKSDIPSLAALLRLAIPDRVSLTARATPVMDKVQPLVSIIVSIVSPE